MIAASLAYEHSPGKYIMQKYASLFRLSVVRYFSLMIKLYVRVYRINSWYLITRKINYCSEAIAETMMMRHQVPKLLAHQTSLSAQSFCATLAASEVRSQDLRTT